MACLQRIVDRGAVETAHRMLNYLVEIYRWAIPHNMVERNIAADLVGTLPASDRPELPQYLTDPERIGELLRASDVYQGSYITRDALQIAPLVFTRPSELRTAFWTEFDLDEGAWAVPGEGLKMRKALKATASRPWCR